jgi:hypothetical protein
MRNPRTSLSPDRKIIDLHQIEPQNAVWRDLHCRNLVIMGG